MEITKGPNHVIAKFGKDIIGSFSNKLRTDLNSLIKNPSCDLILDFIGVKKIDSVGIGLIIFSHGSLLKNGYSLRIINLNKNIYDLFCSMRLDRHLIIEKDNIHSKIPQE